MDLLVLVLDLNPLEWGKRGAFPPSTSAPDAHSTPSKSDDATSPPAPFGLVFAQVLVFLNAFLLLSKQNRLAVIAAHPNTAAFLYPTPLPPPSSTDDPDASDSQASFPPSAPPLPLSGNESNADPSTLPRLLHSAVRSLLHLHSTIPPSSPPLLAGALSLALCHINRVKRGLPKLRSRILLLSASPDSSSSYVPFMNCIFSAHKLSLPLDALVLHPLDSLYLQQAASITSGVYVHPSSSTQRDALLPLLLLHFLPDPVTRQQLTHAGQVEVDYRAVCFCHGRSVSQAMVCPVCLAVYCTATPRCPMCDSAFMTAVVSRGGGVAQAGAATGGRVKEEKEEKGGGGKGKREREEQGVT